jgi:hypothetical protein
MFQSTDRAVSERSQPVSGVQAQATPEVRRASPRLVIMALDINSGRERRALLVVRTAALLLLLVVAGMHMGYVTTPYLEAALAIAAGCYGLYRVVLVRVRVQREMMPSLKAAHSRTPQQPFHQWLGLDFGRSLDFGKLGTVKPGSADAAMHAELGTISSERLKQGQDNDRKRR